MTAASDLAGRSIPYNGHEEETDRNPAAASLSIARRRLAGGRAPGSRRRIAPASSEIRLMWTESGFPGERGQQVDIANDQGAFRGDRTGVSRLQERFEAATGDPVRSFKGWYGSVAVPMTTVSFFQPGRRNSSRRTSGRFVLTKRRREKSAFDRSR